MARNSLLPTQSRASLLATGSARLAWSATTRSVDLSSAKAITDDISRRVLPDMLGSGLLAAPPPH